MYRCCFSLRVLLQRDDRIFDIWYLIYLLTAIGLIPSGSSTVHIYTHTIDRTTQLTKHRTSLIGKSAGRAPSLRVTH